MKMKYKYVWAFLAAVGWWVVALGLPQATLVAVLASFATLDYIVHGDA